MKAAALILAVLVVDATGALLRAKPAEPAKPAAIKEKWDKMDGFLEVMFTMACKWKNGKDVNGLATEALKKGKVDGKDGYDQYVKDLQASNVKGLQRTCGMIVAEDKKACRDGCAERWNQKATARDECDEKCNSVYSSFETRCNSQADNLSKVYAQKSQKAAGQQQCYKGFCGEFPQVWMKEDAAKMEKEVTTQCKDRCTDKNVKLGCQQKWAAEIDFVIASVRSKCAAESGVKKCFDKEQKTVSTAYDKCQKDVKKDCGTAYDTCTKKGNADKNFKDAKAFCDDRKKMCEGQADAKCLSENKAGLKKAEAKCEKENSKALNKCQDDETDKQETAAEKKCIADRKPKCKGECAKSCQVGKMNTCLDKLKTTDDPGKLFCKDFWSLLHSTAAVDPVTGNPIAM